MLAYTFSAIVAIAVSSASAQTQSVCSNAPFKGLGCLASNTVVESRCATLIPAKTETVTSTTSVFNVITETASPSPVASQVTVSITNAETSTVTVTCSETPTSYKPVFATTCVSSTISTYVQATATPAARQKRQVASMLCQASGLAAIAAMETGQRKTACSCLGLGGASTTTSTMYVTVPVPSTTTTFLGKAPTVTSAFIDRVTITETATPSAVVIPLTATTTLTETTTLSFAAPTYTQIYGPKSGCADVSSVKTQPLAPGCDKYEDAVSQCQDICAQESTCRFLYVQRMFTNYGDAKPHFQCYMNDHELDESKDLQCGKKEGIFGNARGYDACDRGTTALE